MLEQLRNLSVDPAPDISSKYFADQIRTEQARWKPVIEQAGIKPD